MQKKFLRTSLVVVGLFCSSLNPTTLMAGLDDELDTHVGTIVRHEPGQNGHNDLSRPTLRDKMVWMVNVGQSGAGTISCHKCMGACYDANRVIQNYVPNTDKEPRATERVYKQFASAAANRL